MTVSNDPDQIRAEIAHTRAELSENVDTLTDTANPKHIAERQLGKVSNSARSLRNKVMGASDDPQDRGQVGNAQAAVSQASDAVGDAVSEAPSKAKEKTRGNPLATGLVAFGVGLLLSSLIPASKKEQEAFSNLQQNLEPLADEASAAAKQMAENLREPARDAAGSVRAAAADATQDVKEKTQDAERPGANPSLGLRREYQE